MKFLNAEPIVDSLSQSEFNLVKVLEGVNEDNIHTYLTALSRGFFDLLINIAISLLIYFIGRWLIRKVVLIVDLACAKRELELSVRSFLKSVVTIALYIVLVLTVVQILGINTTSLVAMLASAGLAVGMALSGTLQNFAGGIMILFLKPYKIGDYIDAQGESGVVKDIMLFTTVLETYDRKTIFVPNSSISSSVINNYSHANTRRVDWTVGISYGDSVSLAREVIMEIFEQDERILKDDMRTPTVSLTALADSSVNLVARAWVNTDDYWSVYFDVYEKIYVNLPERGVNFPFPQLDVHLKKELNK